VQPSKEQVLERERHWGARVGLAAVAGAILALIGFVLLQTSVGNGANFEGLREADKNGSSILLAGIASAIGFLLVAPALLFLFKAAQARSPRVKNQMVGLVLLGPLLLAVAGIMLSAGTREAADTYVNGNPKLTLTPKEATAECRSQKTDKGAKDFADEFEASGEAAALTACEAKKTEEDLASNAIRDSTLVNIAQFAGFAGGLALVVALLYTGLWAMRTGLLTRFWGSLGMASGIAALIGFSPIALVWFLYLGILLVGRLPGGRPPAWAAGEAIPWPTPGQKVADELRPADPDAEVIDVDPADLRDPSEPNGNGDGGDGPERRKRKKRA
jgi:uncharacterized membrane protein